MDLRASAPEFVPAARKGILREADGGVEENPGDRLIRQLAAALAAAPTEARPYVIPAAGLFCPDCIAGRSCTFHRPTVLGWSTPAPSTAANLPHSLAAHLTEQNTKGQCWPAGKAQTETRCPLSTTPPTSSLPALPMSPCADAMPVPHGLICAPGAWHWPDDRRERIGKGAELDDTSTDVGGSEPHHAESDASDPSPDSTSNATHRWRGQHRGHDASLPYKNAVSAPNARPPLKQRAAGRGATAR